MEGWWVGCAWEGCWEDVKGWKMGQYTDNGFARCGNLEYMLNFHWRIFRRVRNATEQKLVLNFLFNSFKTIIDHRSDLTPTSELPS